ncbi:MAG: DUF2812 domain-containing protein [Clostridiales bacterium]|nr:DUF2812 domain-containing protein [Clostridiales bacterium]
MKTKKYRFENFLFYDCAGIERHLEKMSAKGWQLSKINRFIWVYRRSEPKKFSYTATYFPEASDFNPYPTYNQQTFHDYCKDAGWQLAAEWAQMQIFCSAEENPTPIETEEPVKLKAIHRSMLKNFLPGNVLLLLLFMLSLFFLLQLITNTPVHALANNGILVIAFLFSLLAVYLTASLIGYARWYFRSKRAVKTGGNCVEIGSGYIKVSVVMFGISIAVILLFALTEPNGWLVLAHCAGVMVIMVLVLVIQNFLKRMEVTRSTNIGVTILSAVVLSLILNSVIPRVASLGKRAGWFGQSPAKTYTTTINNMKHTWEYYSDPLPLTLEDLRAADKAFYSYEWNASESLLLARYSGRQVALPDYERGLFYSIVIVKWPALFDLCLNDYLNMYNKSYLRLAPSSSKKKFLKTDDPVWQADAVYQLYDDKAGAKDDYILCWGNRIVYIDFNEMPTSEQIAVASAKLRGYPPSRE